jgi:gliotoxin/aspirochlorine biosynthesis thioredoxin reductase
MNYLDVLIIGAGPGGLSLALGLARQLHTAVVFDSGSYRNSLGSHMHNVVTWDHEDPAVFRAAARKNILKRYDTIQFQDVAVESVSKTPQGLFKAVDATGKSWMGRKLVLATGVKDILPDIDGYADCWARGMYVTLFSLNITRIIRV